eukprot:647339-Rhodomonas_salina.1
MLLEQPPHWQASPSSRQLFAAAAPSGRTRLAPQARSVDPYWHRLGTCPCTGAPRPYGTCTGAI